MSQATCVRRRTDLELDDALDLVYEMFVWHCERKCDKGYSIDLTQSQEYWSLLVHLSANHSTLPLYTFNSPGHMETVTINYMSNGEWHVIRREHRADGNDYVETSIGRSLKKAW